MYNNNLYLLEIIVILVLEFGMYVFMYIICIIILVINSEKKKYYYF